MSDVDVPDGRTLHSTLTAVERAGCPGEFRIDIAGTQTVHVHITVNGEPRVYPRPLPVDVLLKQLLRIAVNSSNGQHSTTR